MSKEIRLRGEFHWKLKDYFLTELLLKSHKIKRVENDPDLTIGVVEPVPLTEQFMKSPKSILVAGENLFYRANLFKTLEYLTKKTKIRFDILNKVLPRKMLDMKLGLIRKQYSKYVLDLAKKSQSGKFAIVCNDIKGRNILNLPFFLQVKQILNRIKELPEPKKIKASSKKKFCCIIISNESAFDRINFFKELSKYKKVDCFGRTSLTNSDNNLLPKCWSDNPKFLSQYKFVISFENSFENEYITEKLVNTMLGKSVPIYKGAPNVSEYFSTESFINFDDYGRSYRKMIKKIIELDKDDKKYEEFLKKPWLLEKNEKKISGKIKELEAFAESIVNE